MKTILNKFWKLTILVCISGITTAQKWPSASFTTSVTTGCSPLTVNFTNHSQNSVRWFWDFGDGTTSEAKHPDHIYYGSGTYTVVLVAYDSSNISDVSVKPNCIKTDDLWETDFAADTTITCNAYHPFLFSASDSTIVSRFWQFGDGNTDTSANPAHAYSSAGTWSVTLIAVNKNNCKDTVIKNNYLTVDKPLKPLINTNAADGCAPFMVKFSAVSPDAVEWQWDFGDSTFSNDKNPSHAYPVEGIFDVSLNISTKNNCISDTTYKSMISVYQKPAASFSIADTSACAPYKAIFTNNSLNAGYVKWDFGNGVISNAVSPEYIYNESGYFTVSVTAYASQNCYDKFVIDDAVKVVTPQVRFNTGNYEGCAPLDVSFNDSSRFAENWLWRFGDGNYSNQQNPFHTYQNKGSYNVTLIATNHYGCTDSTTYNSYISASNKTPDYTDAKPLTVCSPFTMSFSDQTNDALSWKWDFGDGQFSNAPNPVHTYNNSGSYIVSLIVRRKKGCTMQIPVFNRIEVSGGGAGFTINMDSLSENTIHFIDTSVNSYSWLWQFGDGNFSTLQNPVHTFDKSGIYPVSLTITTPEGCEEQIGKIIPLIKMDTTDLQSGSDTSASTDGIGGGVGSGGLAAGSGNTAGIEFSDSNYLEGCAPLRVYFQNPVSGITSQIWDFGDGYTSNESNPVHIYKTSGIFNLKLAYCTSQFCDTLIAYEFFRISGISTGFTLARTSKCDSFQIGLNDTAAGAQYWLWDFGDSVTSSAQNPVHSYPLVNAIYNISLTAADTSGCASSAVSSVCTGISEPVFNYPARLCAGDTADLFSDLAEFSSCLWDMGNGETVSGISSSYIYKTGGEYKISLTITDSSGCIRELSLPDTVYVFEPKASFSMNGFSSVSCDSLIFSPVNNSTGAQNFLWNFGGGIQDTAKNPVHTYYMAGKFKPMLTAYQNGCSNTFVADSEIMVNKAKPDFSFTQTDFCLPVSISFTDKTGGAADWFWEFGDGDTSHSQHPVHLFNTVPSSDVKLTINDTNNCSSSLIKPQFDLLKAGFKASDITGCAPLEVSFSDLSIHAAEWKWHFGDSGISSSKNPKHIFQEAGIYDVMLVVKASDECIDTLKMQGLIKTSRPRASFSSGDTVGCSPHVVRLSNNSSGEKTLLWDFGDGTFSEELNPDHIYISPRKYDVALIAIDSMNCRDTISEMKYVSVRGPIAEFGFSETTGCEGLSVHINNTTINGADYQWYFGDGDTSTQSDPVHIFNAHGKFAVTVIASDTNGCSSLLTAADSIEIHPKPKASFTIGDTAGCEPFSCKFNFSIAHTDFYELHLGDNIKTSDTLSVHQYINAGIYYPYITLVNDFGCADSLKHSPINVLQTPSAGFEVSATEGCPPFTASFFNNSVKTQNVNYLWKSEGKDIDSQRDPVITFKYPGKHTITLIAINGNGCDDSVSYEDMITVYDTIPPAAPDVFAVTATDTGIGLLWEKSDDNLFEKYLLYRIDPYSGAVHKISDISEAAQTSFHDAQVATGLYPGCYKIQTSDRCNYRERLDSVKINCSIHLTAGTEQDRINLTWTRYAGCDVDGYEIFRTPAGEANEEIRIASVASSSYFYSDTSLVCPSPYNYRIAATGLCSRKYTSSSNKAAAKPVDNKFLYQKVDVIRTTVVDDAFVLTEWKASEIAAEHVTGYEVQRSDDGENFFRIATLSPSANAYIDYAVEVNENQYHYKIFPMNPCSAKSADINESTSILLETLTESDGSSFLKWTPYLEWKEGVAKYIIEILNEKGEWEVLKEVGGNITNHNCYPPY